MFSRCKPVAPTARAQFSLACLFALSIFHLVGAPLFNYYWLGDSNGPVLTPDVDYRLNWMPDADFRGLDAEKGAEYTVSSPGGLKSYAAGETWRRFRPYYVPSPDGSWHLQVLARGPMNPYALRGYVGMAMGPLVFSVFGLVICLSGLRADSSSKAKEPDPVFHDLS
jgi:hypothetical protein